MMMMMMVMMMLGRVDFGDVRGGMNLIRWREDVFDTSTTSTCMGTTNQPTI